MNNAARIRSELLKCSRCGKCLSVCPTYQLTTDEMRVARGRMALAEAVVDAELGYTAKLKESIQSCLKCFRCSWACPSGVEVQTVITLLRQWMPRKYGLSLWNKFVFRYVLPRRRLTDTLVRLASVFQVLIPGKKGMTRHLPLLFKGRRRIPHLPARTALERFGTEKKAHTNAVYLFTGCLMNYAYPEMIRSAVRSLNKLGYDVVVPRDQLCCGTPVLSLGDVEHAKRLAERNLSAFPGKAPIIVPCASCAKTLKDEYPALLGEKAEPFSRRVTGFSEFVSPRLGGRVTPLAAEAIYHDPCHLRYGRNIVDQPRDVLRKAAQYVPSEGEDLCCGMGGLFSVHHYGMASRIAGKKVGVLQKAKGDIVVTECPGCILQLRDQLTQSGNNLPVRHIAEVVEEAVCQSSKPGKS